MESRSIELFLSDAGVDRLHAAQSGIYHETAIWVKIQPVVANPTSIFVEGVGHLKIGLAEKRRIF